MTVIREYKENDELKILDLYKDVFTRKRDRDFWKWQFRDNPGGDALIVVTEDKEDIIGQVTMIPNALTYKGKDMIGGHSIDAMVEESHRRKGIYENMSKEIYRIGSEREVDFQFGFPVFGALIGLLEKLDANLVDNIPIYIRVNKEGGILSKLATMTNPFKRRTVQSKTVGELKHKFNIIEINEFNEDFDNLWDKIRDDCPIMTNRSSKFLNWRIKDHPSMEYISYGAYSEDELEAYIILKLEDKSLKGGKGMRVGSIIDIIGLNNDAVESLVDKALGFFQEKNTEIVSCWCSKSMLYKDLMVEYGFKESRSTIGFTVKELKNKVELNELIIQEENWHMMPIESDIY